MSRQRGPRNLFFLRIMPGASRAPEANVFPRRLIATPRQGVILEQPGCEPVMLRPASGALRSLGAGVPRGGCIFRERH